MAKDSLRYFSSFSAVSHPLTPLTEIDENAARKLPTYYDAEYDSEGRLYRFTKYLRLKDPEDRSVWQESFTEEYEYFASGRLKQRRHLISGGASKTWKFADKPATSLEYLVRFASGLFPELPTEGNKGGFQLDTENVVERLAVCHELFGELENSVFETIAREQRSTEVILPILSEQLPTFKFVLQLLCPDSNPAHHVPCVSQ